jgi:8-oxo-dGTP pyrophosphatase MutT (NUDIX family)
MSPEPELVESLETASLVGVEQEKLRAEMLAFAQRHPDSLLRTCEPGHFTGSAIVVDDDRARVLLMLHAKAGLWLQPGGHADGQADLGAVALREATEETGIEGLRLIAPAIDLDIHLFRPRLGEPHRHLDVRYLVMAPARSVARGNDESRDLRWVSLGELGDYGVDRGLLRLARRGVDLARSLS